MSSKKGNIEKNLNRYVKLVSLSSIVIILLTLIAYAINNYINLFFQLDTEKLGHFGDFIGGFVGVMLTFLATVLIYFTYKSQKEELQLNRDLFSKQQFENTFFNMLKVHQDLKHNISCDLRRSKLAIKMGAKYENRFYYNKALVGKEFFIGLNKLIKDLWKFECGDNFQSRIIGDIDKKHKKYKYKYDSQSSNPLNKEVHEHLKDINFKYEIFWDYFKNYLGDYFRNIYHILKYISDEKIKEINNLSDNGTKVEAIEDKYKNYADILQSQMSFSELFLIFYNALSFPNMKSLINEFNFIENLYIDNLLHPKHAKFEGIGNIKTT